MRLPPRLSLKHMHRHGHRKESPGAYKLSRARSLTFVAEPRHFTDFQFAKGSTFAARSIGAWVIVTRIVSPSHKPVLLLGAGKDRRGPLVRQLYAGA